MQRSVLLGCLLAATSAWAAPTGLNTIPTADLVPLRSANVALQNGNTDLRGSQSLFRQPEPVPQTELGLPWRFEGGLDVAPSDPPDRYRPQFNLKWTPLPEDYQWPAVAGGVSQLGPGFMTNYFLVASRTLNYEQIQYQKFRAHHRNIKLRGIRAHAGILRTVGNQWHALIGTDVELSDHFVLYADWISSAQNAFSLGGVIVIDRENSLQLALFRGNQENRISGLLLNFTHTFSW